VGDPDQALFAFTGTRPELVGELSKHPDVTPVELGHNYRCGAEIIRIANLMRKGKIQITGNRAGGHVSAIHCPGGLDDQYNRAVEQVRAAAARGIPFHEIAVLCPLNDQCAKVAELLRVNGIPAFARESDYRLTNVTMFIEGCAAWALLGREGSGHQLDELLRRWRFIIGGRWTRTDDVALVELLMSYTGRPDSRAETLVSDLLSIGLRRTYEQAALADDAIELRRMSAGLASGKLRDLTVIGLANRARKIDRVDVTTMTSSKGLEFDVVLLVGADEEIIPHYLSLNDPEKLAEDRRKFYVSVTRARDEVRVFYSGFVTTPWGR
jgi:DNA helicase II / ATP-dependent DNA helicase PcrA